MKKVKVITNRKHEIYNSDWAVEDHKGDIWDNFYDFHFDEECGNLNKELDSRIIVIADLGLWNGRKSGYNILNRRNLNEIMYVGCGCDKCIYFDGKNVRMDVYHHDGCNHYTFRLIKEDKNIDNLCDKIYNGTHTNKDISNYTTSLGKFVKEIYGW